MNRIELSDAIKSYLKQRARNCNAISAYIPSMPTMQTAIQNIIIHLPSGSGQEIHKNETIRRTSSEGKTKKNRRIIETTERNNERESRLSNTSQAAQRTQRTKIDTFTVVFSASQMWKVEGVERENLVFVFFSFV